MIARFGALYYPRVSGSDENEGGCIQQRLIKLLHQQFLSFRRERLVAAYVSASGHVIAAEVIAGGGTSGVVAEARNLFTNALLLDARGLALAHNHPSGDPMPSEIDRRTTETIRQMADLLGIELIDHFIFGRSSIYSIRQGQLM